MSSRSRSRKSSTSTNTNVNGVFNGSGNVQLTNSSQNDITLTDHGAIDKAFDFGEDVVDQAFDSVGVVTDKAFDFGGDALEVVQDFGGEALTAVKEFGSDAFSAHEVAQETVSNALSAVNASNESTLNTLKDFANNLKVGEMESAKLISLSLIVAVAVAAIFIAYFIARKK